MADAYLESPANDRLARTEFMLVKMGVAVMNGAATTIGAAGFMCATYIIFLQKFGIVILVTVAQSLITSLFFFSAMMALVGPQGTFGEISFSGKICSKWPLSVAVPPGKCEDVMKTSGLEVTMDKVGMDTDRESSTTQGSGS